MIETATLQGPIPVILPRGRDRRAGLDDVVAALSRSVGDRTDAGLLRGAFEHAVRTVLQLRSVQLRDNGSRWSSGRSDAGSVESIALEVPGLGPGGVLEASLEPGAPLGDWDVQLLGAAAHLAGLVLEIERCRSQLARSSGLPVARPRREGAAPLIGTTRAMCSLREQIARVAATDFTILLEGESGVGKELVARQIHESSRRRTGPFVALNCAALVETLLEAELFGIEDRTATGVRGRRGKFEHADGGTLFLDEVSDLSPSAQAKLLRTVQDLAVERVGGQGTHRVDVRIVAATNRPLSDLVSQRLFRADLFYRLSGVDLHVPPLRERRGDILDLAMHFISRHRAIRPLRLSAAAADALTAYDWPGNVRELERLIERTVALAHHDIVELDDLPPSVLGLAATSLVEALQCNETLRACGARYARAILDRCRGNKREAARILGISYHTLNVYLHYPRLSASGAEEHDEEPSSAEEVAPTECAT
jgi:transcriptional regulator with PAS, ATPase and Fis domain